MSTSATNADIPNYFIDHTDVTNELFEHIRNHRWKEFINLLETDKTIDINVRDKHSNYMLNYAVRFNRLDIVSKLLDNGAMYDIVDHNDRSILYDAIKYGFIEIAKKLIEISKTNIGITITNIRDRNKNIPLHYAIKFKNLELVHILVENRSNIHWMDSDGYATIHLAVRSGEYEIVKTIIEVSNNIDIKTLKGETALHIAINYKYNNIVKLLLREGASPNMIDDDIEFSALHYAVGWNNIEVVQMLLDMGSDPNIQDSYGNTALMYCAKEDYIECFDMIINFFKKPNSKFKPNLSMWNIDGKTILHEVFETYTEEKKNYVDKLIENTGINIQDINGNTCMHYLLKYDLVDAYIDILKQKKINVFAKNSNGISVIDMILPKDKKNKDMQNQYKKNMDIVTYGYIASLKREKKDFKTEIDKICSRDISELTESEREMLGINTDNKNSLDENMEAICFKLIRSKLQKEIDRYQKGEYEYCNPSQPSNNTNCIKVTEGTLLDVCTFTGSLLDILLGLMFLVKKHSNSCTTLGKSHTPNNDMCNFYKSMGLLMNGRCEFINFEIVWIEYKLYMLDKFAELFSLCVQSNARFIILPLGIVLKNGSHANYLIYDKILKELERFEPHGGSTPSGFNYNAKNMDDLLFEYFKSIDQDIKYFRPNEFIPKIGFQIMESRETKHTRIGDPGGFCALWSIWYVDQRLTYHTYTRDNLIEILFEDIRVRSISYKNMIRNYSRNIITERDKLLKKAGMDINDWMNENYTYNQHDKLLALLMEEINRCCVAKNKVL